LADAGGVGALEHGLVFVGETGVGQVDADIDELHGATSDRRPESISELSIYQKSQELQRVIAVF
jgi:hypothetical protein